MLFFVGLVCLLPRSLAQRTGRFLGRLAFYFVKRERAVALENLQRFVGLPPEKARRVALQSFRQAGEALLDLLWAPRMIRIRTRKDIEFDRKTRLLCRRIRRSGRGAVLATSHFGNWEFSSLSAPYTPLPPMTVIVRPIPNPLVDRIVHRLRSWTGQKLIHRDGAAYECMQRVRDGEVVAIPFDLPVPPDVGAEPVEFFGLPAYTTVAVGYVAALTKAPVYLAHLEPVREGRYRLVLRGPLHSAPGKTLRETAVATTRNVSRALEEAIRQRPGAWAWWLKRWRIWPKGQRGPYPSYAIAERYLWPDGTRRRDSARKRYGAERYGAGSGTEPE